MASIPCPKCQADVPVRVKICPQCGTLVRPVGQAGKFIALALVAVILACVVGALMRGPAP